MIINLSEIKKAVNKDIRLVKDGWFNSFALLNGSLKRDNILLSYIEDEKYLPDLISNNEISCIICKDDILKQVEKVFNGGIVASKDPRAHFFIFHNYLNKNTDFYENYCETYIDSSADINRTAIIPDKNVMIGKNTKIMGNVVIYENTIIGDNVTIREGSVIGVPGFYYFSINGNNEVVDSVGGVIIKDNVEIHTNTVICKGVLGGNTVLGDYTKLSNNVSVSHDVKINENCLITAGTILAGVVTVKKNTLIGVGANVVPLITIGENCKVSAGSIVTKNVQNDSHVSGNFAIEHNRFINFIKRINEENFI